MRVNKSTSQQVYESTSQQVNKSTSFCLTSRTSLTGRTSPTEQKRPHRVKQPYPSRNHRLNLFNFLTPELLKNLLNFYKKSPDFSHGVGETKQAPYDIAWALSVCSVWCFVPYFWAGAAGWP